MTSLARDRTDLSASFYRGLVDSVPEAIIVTRPDGTIVYINPASERLLGYALDEVAGRSVSTLVPQQPDRRADAIKWLERWASESNDTQSRFLDLIAATKSGRQMPVDVRVVEAKLDGERRYIITFRDNTARRAEQAAFKEAHLRASRILQIAEDGIVSADATQAITFFNLKAEAMFGYRAEEVVGRPLATLLPDRYRQHHSEDVARFGSGKQASRQMNERGAVWGRRKSGEEFPLEIAITKVSVAGALTYTAHLRDITQRREREQRLQESERRFRAIFEHAFEAVGLLSPDGTVLEINRAGRLMTEGTAPLAGLALWDLPWAGSDQAPDDAARQRLKGAVARAARGETVRYTETLTGPGEPVRTIDISLTPIRDESGKVIYIVPEGRETA
jgi:PAS domain S-box-containing protein